MSLLIKSFLKLNTSQRTRSISVAGDIFKYLGASVFLNQSRTYAARKGTRERRKKQKVKIEQQKIGFIPHNQRDQEKLLSSRVSRKFDDSWKRLPTDDVYPHKYYQWKAYDFIEAVECHRETHHPEMYNQPSALLHLTVELNMSGEKKNKFIDNFSSIVAIPHKFDLEEERTILVFSKDIELVEQARQAGAQLAGGAELVKEFQTGNLSIHDFQFVVAHPDILPELVVLRGLMKKKFPNIRNGTLEVNIVEAVEKFKTGIQYSAVKDEYEKDFGSVEVVIGKLDMDLKHLEANFIAVLNNIHLFKPKRQGTFITRCLLVSPPSRERFKLDHRKYLKSSGEKLEKEEVKATIEEQAVAV